ncbi:MAG: GTPase ObgE [Flavobacteriales bacterium]
MLSSDFIDRIEIRAQSGRGGAGSAHLRREKFVPKGGPDGGDGGRGGHVILRGSAQRGTLFHLKYARRIQAGNGRDGGAQRATGADGRDAVVAVPLGTVVKSAQTGEILFEMIRDGEERVLVEGGQGGLGNWHFRRSTRQTPRYAQPGGSGREVAFVLELKVLADVGLVGFPNAGKSTLLAALTSAKPRIADFAFTTLRPELGVVRHRDYTSFVMADIPGIIAGAARGKGLGQRFLRHVERNAVLLFLIPADAPDPYEAYRILSDELQRYNPQLSDKERVVAISKADLSDAESERKIAARFSEGMPDLFFSAVSGRGLTALKDLLWEKINKAV